MQGGPNAYFVIGTHRIKHYANTSLGPTHAHIYIYIYVKSYGRLNRLYQTHVFLWFWIKGHRYAYVGYRISQHYQLVVYSWVNYKAWIGDWGECLPCLGLDEAICGVSSRRVARPVPGRFRVVPAGSELKNFGASRKSKDFFCDAGVIKISPWWWCWCCWWWLWGHRSEIDVTSKSWSPQPPYHPQGGLIGIICILLTERLVD